MAGAKKLYKCDRCIQLFRGRTDFDYHISAHRRADPPKRREVTPKRTNVCYTEPSGNEPADMKETQP